MEEQHGYDQVPGPPGGVPTPSGVPVAVPAPDLAAFVPTPAATPGNPVLGMPAPMPNLPAPMPAITQPPHTDAQLVPTHAPVQSPGQAAHPSAATFAPTTPLQPGAAGVSMPAPAPHPAAIAGGSGPIPNALAAPPTAPPQAATSDQPGVAPALGGSMPELPTIPQRPIGNQAPVLDEAPPAGQAPPAAPPPAKTADGATPKPTLHVGNFRGATAMQLQAKRLRIGEVLIDMGIIDQGQLEHALAIQKETGIRLGKVLIQEGLVSSTDIAKALARRLSIEYIDLNEIRLEDVTLGLMPFNLCTRYDVVPIGEQGSTLLIAMADPTNVFALDDIRLVTGRDIRVVVANPESIDYVLSQMISLDESVAGALANADDWKENLVPLEDIKDSNSDAPAIKLVNQIITQAVVIGASDLHFEPQAEDMVVRFRKDGVLHHVTTVPNKLRPGVTSRLKIMASMDISERRRPQDGRVGLLVGDRAIDLRVAVLPTVYGEKAVLRVLDKSNVMLTMDQLGLMPEQVKKLRYCYTQPYGCLLVTGPTGSGKTTTLYAALHEINDIEKNIITVEDPVEYRLKGINQVQVNVKAGLSFASSLRSILRCDPDIVMIGEMRDLETASIGIEAALTGHLVLSTLHTNDAPGALTRLTEMGVEPFLVASSVLGVLAQRLLRRLCKCKEAWTPTRDYLAELGFPQDVVEGEAPTLYKAVGCHRCGGKGYQGRMGIHEVMLMSDQISELANRHTGTDEIARLAVQQGMTTLYMDGITKILLGNTTIEELNRVVQH